MASDRPLPGASLARHVPHLELLALAGKGSFGEVWLVQDRRTGRLHALKQLRADCPNPAAARQLLWNEAEVGRRVTSDYVVRVGEAFLDATPPHLILEWLSGETLESRLLRERQLSCQEAFWIARQCAQGLLDLLRAGFTHGDVKPSNIFLCRSGLAKLIDLGFARPDQRLVDDLDDRSRTLSGTPEYLAPETLVPSERSGVARDLYSLGVTLYRMLTGALPFQGTSVGEIVRQQQQTRATRLRTLAPHAPPEAEELVHQLLAKQPLRRGPGLRPVLQTLIGLELATVG
ncbi:MAG: serine/threonine-protein kinase [Acidobacteriota bacterium]